jgi:hypothetical protein
VLAVVFSLRSTFVVLGDTVIVSTSPPTDAHILDSNFTVSPRPDGEGDCVFPDPGDTVLNACVQPLLDQIGIPPVPCIPALCPGNFCTCLYYPDLPTFPRGPITTFGDLEIEGVTGTLISVGRTVLLFDLSVVPAHAVITDARLVLSGTTPGESVSIIYSCAPQTGVIEPSLFEAEGENVASGITSGPIDIDVTSQITADYSAGLQWVAMRVQLENEGLGPRTGVQFTMADDPGIPPQLIIEYDLLPQAFEVDASDLTIAEGGSAQVNLQLAIMPGAPVDVTITAFGPDGDLVLQSSSMFQLSDTSPTAVVFNANSDADYLNGTAQFVVSSSDVPNDLVLKMTEADGDPVPSRLYVNAGVAGGASTGADWANAFLELNEALGLAADSSTSPIDVWIAQGTYVPAGGVVDRSSTFFVRAGVALYGGFDGTETMLAERSPSEHDVILDGDWNQDDSALFGNTADNVFHVVTVDGAGIATLDGVTVRGGNSDGAGCVVNSDRGGAVFVKSGKLIAMNVRFHANQGVEGGAIKNESEIEIADCWFDNNLSSDRGGAIFNGSETVSSIQGSVFIGNQVVDQPIVGGGAIYSTRSSNPIIDDCLFLGNSATGGALGGALYNNNTSVTVTNSRFIGNYTENDGGAVLNVSTTDASSVTDVAEHVFTNCVFAHNFAVSGGGALTLAILEIDVPVIDEPIPGVTVLTNCILWANRDAGSTGASENMCSVELPTGTDCTAQLNEVLTADGTIPLDIGILHSNLTVTHSIVQGGWPGAGNLSVDPLLTADAHLRSGSLAIEAGIDTGTLPSTDIDGELRVLDGDGDLTAVVDIGADEFLDSDGDGLPDWWEAQYELLPSDDQDGDGLTAIEEFELGSNPDAVPVYVNAAMGDDSWDGTSITHQGGTVGPKQTIDGGIKASSFGDTVLLAAGTYTGDDNTELQLANQHVVIHGAGGPASTIVDCTGESFAFQFTQDATPLVALSGLTLRNCPNATAEGTVSIARGGTGHLRNCIVEVPDESGASGLNSSQGTALVVDTTLTNAGSTSDAGHRISRSTLEVQGVLTIENGRLRVDNSLIRDGRTGSVQPALGEIQLGANGVLEVLPGFPASAVDLQCNLSDVSENDSGLLQIRGGTTLVVGDQAVIDFSGAEDTCGVLYPDTTEPDILVEGTLFVTGGATIQNTNLEIVLLNSSGTIELNDIRLLDSTGFGGEFFVEAGTITNNRIISEGDRYLDFDPDPDSSTGVVLGDNVLCIVINEGVGGEQGTLLELRGEDFECCMPGDMACEQNSVNPMCESGVHELPTSLGGGYDSANWVIDRLEVTPGSRVNLTNRPGFDYQSSTASETMYVEELVLHPDAVLNTGLQSLYYKDLILFGGSCADSENGCIWDGVTPFDNGADIVDVPLLGFSLIRIDMEDDTEFDVRVRKRVLQDIADDPDEDTTPLGVVARSDIDIDGDMVPEGVMEMRTKAGIHPAVLDVRAKGSFARASSGEDVKIVFDYKFCHPTANAELVVYLSGQTAVGSGDNLEVARITQPFPGRPGSAASTSLATFSTSVEHELNFTRGTYIELELVGDADACVLIDEWDPYVNCLNNASCGDLNGNTFIEADDFLIVLGETGRTIAGDPVLRSCLDTGREDGYFDILDQMYWDTQISGLVDLFNCSPAPDAPSAGTGGVGLTPGALVIGGKQGRQSMDGVGLWGDYIYEVPTDSPVCDVGYDHLTPPSNQEFGNGKLFASSTGLVYQLHATSGVISLSDGTIEVAPGPDDMMPSPAIVVGGDLLLQDAVFDSTDNDVLYLAPVEVIDGGHRAAARVRLHHDGTFMLLNLYEIDPVNPLAGFCNVCSCPPNASDPEDAECDMQNLREIAVADGLVFVTASNHVSAENEWLLVFDENDGTDLSVLSFSEVVAPIGMTVTSDRRLFVASSVADNDAGFDAEATTRIYEYQLTPANGMVTAMALVRTVQIGNMRQVVDIVEADQSGDVWVVGWTAPPEPFDINAIFCHNPITCAACETPDPQYPSRHCEGNEVFTVPTLGYITDGDMMVDANTIMCDDLALPVSAVLVPATTACDAAAECVDLNADNKIDDVCTWGDCIDPPSGTCNVVARSEPSDMGGQFGACLIDGFCNIHDRTHALTCFAGTNPCPTINIDAGGAFGVCPQDGFCNIHDANHALTCFAGTNSCVCGPSPEFAPQVVQTVGTVSLRAEANRVEKAVHVQVFTADGIDRLQSYQLHVDVSGGKSGKLKFADIVIEPRKDWVFAAYESFEAVNVQRGQMLAGVDSTGVGVKEDGYLATFVFEPSADASGTFVIDVLHDHASGDQSFLVSNFTDAVDIVSTKPGIITLDRFVLERPTFKDRTVR